jgi:hypothetical protein
MTFESANRSTPSASVETTAGKSGASGDHGFQQQALVECWPGGPIVKDWKDCPPHSERGIMSLTDVSMLPKVSLGNNAIVFASAEGPVPQEQEEPRILKPGELPPPRTYRINGDGTPEFAPVPIQGPGTWQNPNNK